MLPPQAMEPDDPQGIGITNADVDGVAEMLGCRFDDASRREALLRTTPCDIQACAGSGKTTLLVAKLAILSSKWKWRDRGICVLSHTNVARQEVQSRLSRHPAAHRLLTYPHFIGTIQSFVDRFLALPFLRNDGIGVTVVDNERFLQRALRLLAEDQRSEPRRFGKAWGWLEAKSDHKPHGPGRKLLAGLRYEGPSLELGSAGGELCSKERRAYQQLWLLKAGISCEGIFRYDDMYAFAQAYPDECPWLIGSLRARFPWVFIDEMQDTNRLQAKLLARIFGDNCVVQRFGDVNQAIYDSDDDDDDGAQAQVPDGCFPNRDCILVSDSQRFGETIANFVSPLRVHHAQEITGAPDARKGRHTIFLFDADTIGRVLPSFGDLLADEYADGLPAGFTAKAIGYRRTPPRPEVQQQLAHTIGDYWPGFTPYASTKSTQPSCLIEVVRRAQSMLQEDCECREAYDLLIDGLLQLLNMSGAVDASGKRFTRQRFLRMLRSQDEDYRQRLEGMLCGLCFEETTQALWDATIMPTLQDLVTARCAGRLNRESLSYLQWTEKSRSTEPEEAQPTADRLNVFCHAANCGQIAIEISTIHATKGETHTATLVLDTQAYERHDLEDVLGLVARRDDPESVTRARTPMRMKRVYVAMTRPRELLCLATAREHVNEHLADLLRTSGWIVQDLTLRPEETDGQAN